MEARTIPRHHTGAHQSATFVGAPEVQEIFLLRDQNRSLIKLVAELKADNRQLRRRLGTK
jgi:hypothetical protein